MRLTSFKTSAGETWGVVQGDWILDVGAMLRPQYPDLKSVLRAGPWEKIRELLGHAPRHSEQQVEWLPPIGNPGKILCIGLNYHSHREEAGRAEEKYPTIFTRFADTQLGHRTSILRPRISRALDYEGELAVIIGRSGRYIEVEGAMDHVAGYSCYNDATLRDWQRHTHQFTPGKNFPQTGAFGPLLVTADEVPDYRNLRLATRVNGETVQSAGLDQMIFPIPELIAYCSQFTALAPGDVIVTGTPGGVGFKRNPPRFLRPGDRVEVDISAIGTLSNSIADEE
jgi:2-keto-4-pentenoate hydratase/2-oxohepta-3-ene-1,7-dioic acid hydratase in catechol pathway